jgi:hypothetical protein
MSTNCSSIPQARRSAPTPRRPLRSISCRSLIAIAAVAVGLPAVYSSVASAATTSITDKLSTNKTSVEVASLPAGTQLVKVAVMKNTSGEGVTYKLLPVTQVSFTPPAGYPVVDMQAATSKGSSIGNWAGRIRHPQPRAKNPRPNAKPRKRLKVKPRKRWNVNRRKRWNGKPENGLNAKQGKRPNAKRTKRPKGRQNPRNQRCGSASTPAAGTGRLH